MVHVEVDQDRRKSAAPVVKVPGHHDDDRVGQYMYYSIMSPTFMGTHVAKKPQSQVKRRTNAVVYKGLSC